MQAKLVGGFELHTLLLDPLAKLSTQANKAMSEIRLDPCKLDCLPLKVKTAAPTSEQKGEAPAKKRRVAEKENAATKKPKVTATGDAAEEGDPEAKAESSEATDRKIATKSPENMSFRDFESDTLCFL